MTTIVSFLSFLSCELPSYPLLAFLLGCLFSDDSSAPTVIEEYDCVGEPVTKFALSFLQAQCLINVSGDAVVFVRESELEVVSTQQPTANSQSSCPAGEVTA